MNSIIFITIFSMLAVVYLIVGWRASKKVKTDSDYFVGGRKLGTIQIVCNLIATQIGGGMILGTADKAYSIGYYGILYTLGMVLGFILLSCGVASRLQQFNVITAAQLFETRYGSIVLKKIASILSIITLFGILIAQVVAIKKLMASVGFTHEILFIIFWISVVCYTMLGGLRAITINDMIQLAVIVSVFGSIAIYNLMNEPASFFTWEHLKSQQDLFAMQPLSTSIIFATICMPALFSLIEQDLAQRFFAARTQTIATRSAIGAGIFLSIFACIPIYFGMKAKLTGLVIPSSANPLIIFLEQHTNDVIFALVICAIIAAIISTADALLNGITANITQDFSLAKTFGIADRLSLSKVMTLIVGICALSASYVVPNDIVDIIIESYALSVCCLLVPLIVCYFKPHVKKSAAIGAVVLGFLGYVGFTFYPVAVPKEIIALALSSLGYIIGSLAGK